MNITDRIDFVLNERLRDIALKTAKTTGKKVAIGVAKAAKREAEDQALDQGLKTAIDKSCGKYEKRNRKEFLKCAINICNEFINIIDYGNIATLSRKVKMSLDKADFDYRRHISSVKAQRRKYKKELKKIEKKERKELKSLLKSMR